MMIIIMDLDIFNQKPHHRTEYIIALSSRLHSRGTTKEPDIDLKEEGGFQVLRITLLNVY